MSRLFRKQTVDTSTVLSAGGGPKTVKQTTVHGPSSTIRVGCPAHNCGGRCLLVAHVENGHITRLDGGSQ